MRICELRSCWAQLALVAAVMTAGCNRRADLLGPIADTGAAEAIRKSLLTAQSAGESAAAAAPTGTGWATIKGQFVFEGEPPAMAPYAVTKEHDICSVNGRPPLQETLIVAPDTRAIQNVAIYLRDASRVHDSAMAKPDPVEFDQKQCVFLTHVAGITVGQTLDIKNSDPTGHNTNIAGSGFNQLIPAGGAIPFKIQKEEQVPSKVTCSIHPWMTAYVLPRKNAYFAITGPEGTFEIANVPAGEPLEFQVWHESGAAPGNGLVGSSPDAAEVNWNPRGRLTLTLQPDEVKELRIAVPAKAFRL